MWFVYILECWDGRLYTGITIDLSRRMKQHQGGRGGHFTKSFGVKKFLYSEEQPTRSDALKREAQIKRWSRREKLALVGIKLGRKI